MPKTYNYFNDPALPIAVTDDSVRILPNTFLSNNELWENKALHQFFSRINANSSVNIVDIGAQAGLYSLYAKYLPLANFFAFEPFKQSYDLLQDNLILNGISNVFTFNIALAETSGTAVLNTCKSHFGLHTLGATPLRFSDIEPMVVTTSTLDTEFFDKGIPVHFIKIDTEGGEFMILKGGMNTLAAYKPVIQLEWNLINMQQAGISENQLATLLDSLGYKQIGCEDEERLFACS
jgi:FkbM family methyltransferase